jgi:hypothetical protein
VHRRAERARAELRGTRAARREGLLKLYTKIAADYPIISVEDPFDQDDWDNTTKFTAEGVCQARAPPPRARRPARPAARRLQTPLASPCARAERPARGLRVPLPGPLVPHPNPKTRLLRRAAARTTQVVGDDFIPTLPSYPNPDSAQRRWWATTCW